MPRSTGRQAQAARGIPPSLSPRGVHTGCRPDSRAPGRCGISRPIARTPAHNAPRHTAHGKPIDDRTWSDPAAARPRATGYAKPTRAPRADTPRRRPTFSSSQRPVPPSFFVPVEETRQRAVLQRHGAARTPRTRTRSLADPRDDRLVAAGADVGEDRIGIETKRLSFIFARNTQGDEPRHRCARTCADRRSRSSADTL